MASNMVASGSIDQILQPLFVRMEATVSAIAFTSSYCCLEFFKLYLICQAPIGAGPYLRRNSKPVPTTITPPITLYQRQELPVKKYAAKIAASAAIMPANAPVPPTLGKKKASVNTPSSEP